MTMPAGKYYVGDLCYVMHGEWDEVCDLMFPDGMTPVDGEMALKDGRRFAVYSTKYGDGTYFDNYGREYGVDAGVIGCILVSDIREHSDNFLDGGNVVEFIDAFETGGGRFTSNGNGGIIKFGVVEVDTDPVYDDEFGFEE